METVITVLILILVIGAAAFYVYKSKKSGKKCIGCPDADSCTGNCVGCGCACPRNTKNK